MQPFLIALQFLTIIPVRLQSAPTPQDIGRSLLWYPAVGLLIGLILVLLHFLLAAAGTHHLIHAAILLTAWVVITGALHLDGLGDTVDAWIGGRGDRERTLAIMKDPRSGPMAVVALVLVLLLKFCALAVLVETGYWQALVIAPVLGRAALLVLFRTTTYVRPGGLGQALADNLPHWIAKGLLLAVAVACMVLANAVTLLLAAGLFLLLRCKLVARIGGTTGDTAGAVVESVECALLLGGAVF